MDFEKLKLKFLDHSFSILSPKPKYNKNFITNYEIRDPSGHFDTKIVQISEGGFSRHI